MIVEGETERVGPISYNTNARIGKGSSAKVFLGSFQVKSSGIIKDAAIKKVVPTLMGVGGDDGVQTQRMINNEIIALRDYVGGKCENIIQLYEVVNGVAVDNSLKFVYLALEVRLELTCSLLKRCAHTVHFAPQSFSCKVCAAIPFFLA